MVITFLVSLSSPDVKMRERLEAEVLYIFLWLFSEQALNTGFSLQI